MTRNTSSKRVCVTSSSASSAHRNSPRALTNQYAATDGGVVVAERTLGGQRVHGQLQLRARGGGIAVGTDGERAAGLVVDDEQ